MGHTGANVDITSVFQGHQAKLGRRPSTLTLQRTPAAFPGGRPKMETYQQRARGHQDTRRGMVQRQQLACAVSPSPDVDGVSDIEGASCDALHQRYHPPINLLGIGANYQNRLL
jgi:hypothetical protein